jgi:hypothetical protein
MPARRPVTHLALIAVTLAALAGVAFWYTATRDRVDGVPPERFAEARRSSEGLAIPETKEACEAEGGVWNECASPCAPGVICIQMCVERCEGVGDGRTVVSVYFPNSKLDPEHLDCSVVFPVRRAFEAVDERLGAIEALLKGLTGAERDEGYFTSIPEDTTVVSSRFEGGIVYVDFAGGISKVAGSCRVTAIRAQIEETLKQFSAVKAVVISVDGNVDKVLQP